MFIGFIFVSLFMLSFVSANGFIDSNSLFIKEKMVLDLPELSEFTFGGTWFSPNLDNPFYHIDLRYFSPIDNDQHSEYLLEIFNSSEEATSRLNGLNKQTNFNISLKEINGNKVWELTTRIEPGFRELDWVSGVNLLRGWNGNDIGSVYDNELFNALTEAYLEKYPSTYNEDKIDTTKNHPLMYNNVISEEKLASLSEEGISLSITPLWSAELQTSEWKNVIISFLSVKEINSNLNVIWASNWYYLNDGDSEYLADSSVTYVTRSVSGICSIFASDGTCGVNKILLNFKPESEYQSSTFAYDGFISDVSTRELVENSVPEFELNFNPQTGKLSESRYNGELLTLTNEAGFVSYGEFSLTYGGNK